MKHDCFDTDHFFCFGIVWVFVRVVFEGQPLVLPPNLVMRRLLGNVKQLVEAVSASPTTKKPKILSTDLLCHISLYY